MLLGVTAFFKTLLGMLKSLGRLRSAIKQAEMMIAEIADIFKQMDIVSILKFNIQAAKKR